MIAPVHRLKKDFIIWLSRNKCRHGHSYLEHHNCFLTENPDQMRIGFFDIEASHLKADFGFPITWYILDGNNEYHGRTVTKDELFKHEYPDKNLMKELVKELKNYDLIYTYYGTKFDLPFVRTRCVIMGIPFPFYGTLKHKDVYYTIRNKFNLHRKSLEVACEMLLGETNKTHWMASHWLKAIQGNQKSLDYIDDHCKNDVYDLKKLWEKVEEYAYPISRSI